MAAAPDDDTIRLPIRELKAFTAACLVAAGSEKEKAELVAEVAVPPQFASRCNKSILRGDLLDVGIG